MFGRRGRLLMTLTVIMTGLLLELLIRMLCNLAVRPLLLTIVRLIDGVLCWC